MPKVKSTDKKKPKTATKKPALPLKAAVNAATPAGSQTRNRQLKPARYRAFRLHKPIKYSGPKLIGALRLFGRSLLILKRHWKTLGGILLIYGVLNVLFVRGISSSVHLTMLKTAFEQTLHGGWNRLGTGVTLFGLLLGSSGTAAGQSTASFQVPLLLVVSLALIWALRQLLADTPVRIRDAFYRGMYPVVPFILVLLVISLQLLPLIIGSSLYNLVLSNGIAATAIEKILWAALFFLMVLLSLYMVSSSLFALYIVTLPDMTPIKALRSARQLVKHRRFIVMRKLLFLPVGLLVILAVIVVPIIIFVTPVAEWAFFVLSVLSLGLIHSYMYGLYRELL